VKNPFPEYGEIKEIILNSYYSYQKLINEENGQFLYPVYPDEYELVLIYEKYKAKYQVFNITEQDYKELKESLLDTVKFEAEREGWPYSLIWKNYKFVPVSVEEIIYE